MKDWVTMVQMKDERRVEQLIRDLTNKQSWQAKENCIFSAQSPFFQIPKMQEIRTKLRNAPSLRCTAPHKQDAYNTHAASIT